MDRDGSFASHGQKGPISYISEEDASVLKRSEAETESHTDSEMLDDGMHEQCEVDGESVGAKKKSLFLINENWAPSANDRPISEEELVEFFAFVKGDNGYRPSGILGRLLRRYAKNEEHLKDIC